MAVLSYLSASNCFVDLKCYFQTHSHYYLVVLGESCHQDLLGMTFYLQRKVNRMKC